MTRVMMMNISDVTEEDYRRLYLRSDLSRQKKADRYLRREDRIRCICAGQLLRFALESADFQVKIGPYGKPEVKDRPDFQYNLSHSGNWVVIGCASTPVGIDVEEMDWNPGKEKLSRRFFTPDEQDYVFCQTPGEIAQRFYEIWTAKESYLKYLGIGLQKALDSFSVLQLKSPKRFTLQPEPGYCLSIWTEDEAYDLKSVAVSDLLTAAEIK
jgi:4'-phosphopantetheinyl transferase